MVGLLKYENLTLLTNLIIVKSILKGSFVDNINDTLCLNLYVILNKNKKTNNFYPYHKTEK